MLTTVKDFSQRCLTFPAADIRAEQWLRRSTFAVKSKTSLSPCMCETPVFASSTGGRMICLPVHLVTVRYSKEPLC